MSWGLLVIVGCASRGPADPAPPLAPEPATERSVPEDDIDAQIEREIRLHTLRLEHQDPAEQVRARLDLADAYARRAAQVSVTRTELDARRFAAEGSSRADLDRLDAQLAARRSQWLERAATAYGLVLDSSHPSALELRAEARFGRADVLTQLGDTDGAAEMLALLVREDPEHALAGLALTWLGDDTFANGRLSEARALYEQAVASGSARERSYARYKLAWISLNEADGQAALEHFTKVVFLSRHLPQGRALAEAAARDCVRAYAMVGDPRHAAAFFARLDPQLAPELIERLVQLYVDQGRLDAAKVIEGQIPGNVRRAR